MVAKLCATASARCCKLMISDDVVFLLNSGLSVTISLCFSADVNPCTIHGHLGLQVNLVAGFRKEEVGQVILRSEEDGASMR